MPVAQLTHWMPTFFTLTLGALAIAEILISTPMYGTGIDKTPSDRSLVHPDRLELSNEIDLNIPLLIAQATRFGSTTELEGDVTCGRGTGGPYTFVKTENFVIYVCGDESDPGTPRFYRSFDHEGNLGLSLVATDYDPQQGRYLIFENSGYQCILDGGNAQTRTGLLIVKDPSGKTLTEEVAQVYLVRDSFVATGGCAAGESWFVEAETANFRIYICGGDLPQTYVGVAKQNGSSIELPLESYSSQGDEFVAVNGDVRYLLTPNRLLVTQGSTVLVDEPIQSWNF